MGKSFFRGGSLADRVVLAIFDDMVTMTPMARILPQQMGDLRRLVGV